MGFLPRLSVSTYTKDAKQQACRGPSRRNHRFEAPGSYANMSPRVVSLKRATRQRWGERAVTHSTPELRQLWKAYECKPKRMVVVPFGHDRIRVAPDTADAWTALATVLDHHGYVYRDKDTDSYNCRASKGGGGKSLHSYGIALDVNWTTNPYL